MKRLYLLLIMLLVVFDVSAQENNSRLNVKSLKLIENDTEASRAKKKDGNGDFCALIKIQTPNMNEDERNKLHFSADLGTFTYLDEAIGEVKLFLTEGCKTLIIMHPDYGKLVYSMPIKVAGLRTYEMVLEANKEFVAPVMTINNNYVIINAKPKDATITIDGKYCANGKASISVGEPHKLVVTHDLYHSYEKEIYASPDEKITYDVNLYPAFGWLVINSEPENGAAVFINGERKGVTHFRSDTLKSGDYDVELQKDMFAPVRKTVKVLDNNDAEISIPMQKTHNYVVINATPKDVNITIDGNYYKNGKALLSIGEPHDLVVSRKFYHSEESVVYAMPNEIKTFDMILKPAFGWISINSKPETGATILINGKKIGQTPFKTDTLPSGEYEVTLLKEMYVSVTEHIVVRDNKTTEITLPLNPSFAEISLTTETESSIYIDGELKGKGSWKGRLMEGSYLVESRKPSHRTVSKSVDVYAGLAATIDIGNPIPIYGALDINTDPDEAEIYLDGVKIGETPLIYKNVLIGSHTLKFVKKGCATFIKEVSVEENKLLNVNEKLDSGKVISITTGRNGDDIYVDGELVGKSPMDMAMGYGSHSVKAVRNGKKVEKEIEVMINGGPTSLTLEFGKIVKITTDRKGDDVFVDGKLVGVTPYNADLLNGKHTIRVERGVYYVVEDIDIPSFTKSELNLIYGGKISVKTDRVGDKIYIDDKYAGETPKIVDVSAGTHKVQVVRKDYESINKTVNVGSFESVTVAERLSKNNAKMITIETGSYGDAVYVDGKKVGVTPYQAELDFGTHYIKVERNGISSTASINVNSSSNTNLRINIGGRIKVLTEPGNASVYVDNKLCGNSQQLFDVAVGDHVAKAIWVNGTTATKNVHVESGETMHVTLKSKGNNQNRSSGNKSNNSNNKYKVKTTFMTLDFAYSIAPQASFGLTFGQVKKIGWYASVSTNFKFKAMGAKITCDENGTIYGVKPFYSGDTSKSRLSITGGVLVGVSDNVYLKFGAGYGCRAFAQQTTDGTWIKNKAYSTSGIDLSGGAQFLFCKFNMSANIVTTNFKYAEIKIGLGINF